MGMSFNEPGGLLRSRRLAESQASLSCLTWLRMLWVSRVVSSFLVCGGAQWNGIS